MAKELGASCSSVPSENVGEASASMLYRRGNRPERMALSKQGISQVILQWLSALSQELRAFTDASYLDRSMGPADQRRMA